MGLAAVLKKHSGSYKEEEWSELEAQIRAQISLWCEQGWIDPGMDMDDFFEKAKKYAMAAGEEGETKNV